MRACSGLPVVLNFNVGFLLSFCGTVRCLVVLGCCAAIGKCAWLVGATGCDRSSGAHRVCCVENTRARVVFVQIAFVFGSSRSRPVQSGPAHPSDQVTTVVRDEVAVRLYRWIATVVLCGCIAVV